MQSSLASESAKLYSRTFCKRPLRLAVRTESLFQSSLIAAQAGVERKDMAVVTGTRNFVRNLGGTLGLAVAGAIVNNSIRSALSPLGLPESNLHSLLNRSNQYLSSSLDSSEAEKIRTDLNLAYCKGLRVYSL